MTVLATGAPGNVGTPLVAERAAAGAPVRVAAVDAARDPAQPTMGRSALPSSTPRQQA